MSWYVISLALFVVGIIEHFVDESQNLVSVRLKIGQTFLFSLVNKIIDFGVNVFLFGLLIDFYSKFREGTYEFKTLVPYVFYIVGCIIGTTLALWYYKSNKKKTEKEKRLQHLEKARQIKKQLQMLKDDIITEVETEFEFEDQPIETEKDNGNKAVYDKAKDNGQSPEAQKSS